MSTMREEFEAWMVKSHSSCSLEMEDGGRRYRFSFADMNWDAWQAAYAAGQRDGGKWRLAIDGELVALEIGVAEPSSDARERMKKLIESYVSLGAYEERERCLRALEAEMPTQSMHLIEHQVYANALRDGMRAIRARDKEQG